MRKRTGWAVLFALAAVGLANWWGDSFGWSLKALAGFVGAAVGFLAPLFVDRVRERALAWRKAARVGDPPPPETRAGLLRADRHIVPFIGEDNELAGRGKDYAELREWCQGSKSPVRLVVGAGGVGKTRLALHLGQHLKDCHWSVTVVGAGQEADALTTLREATRRSSIFLIVDYAETRTGLAELLRSVADTPAHVRVLLIARSAGDWWSRLGSNAPVVRHLVQKYDPLTLSARMDSAGSPAELVRAAVPYFATALGAPAPTKIDIRVPDEVPLLVLHAAALVAVLRSQNPQTPAGQLVADLGVLKELLGHESRFWEHSATRAGLGLGLVALQRAVAVACLFGAANESDGAEILSRVPELRDGEGLRRRVAQWLRELYPPSSGYWGSLQPELVAETHVIEQLIDCPELIEDLPELGTEQAYQMLMVLSKGATHRPDGPVLLEQVLRADIQRLVVDGVRRPGHAGTRYPALEVATTTGGELGKVLAQVLDDAPLTQADLIQIAARIPYPTTALAGAAVAVTRRILHALPTDADPAETAHWQERLGVVLAQVGRPGDAQDCIEKAVGHYRKLVETCRERYLPDLARSLHSLGIRLAEQDRRADALPPTEEAIGYYWTLTEHNPSHYRPDLAAAVNNRGIWLAELGRHAEAFPAFQEAAAHYDALVESDPDRYVRERAETLTKQDLSISKAPQETLRNLEADVEHHRVMSEADPDSYLPNLAHSLYNLAHVYAVQDLRAKAIACLEEALPHYHSLATSLDRYRPDLAACLNNLGVNVAELGDYAKAVSYAEEAVILNRRLAQNSPERYGSELAKSLDNLAFCRFKLGQHNEALKPAEDAIELYQDLVKIAPDRYRPELARALDNLGVSLSELRRHAEALPAAREAVRIYEDLVDTHSNRYWCRLHQARRNLAVDYSELSRYAEADRCRQEADRIREEHGDVL